MSNIDPNVISDHYTFDTVSQAWEQQKHEIDRDSASSIYSSLDRVIQKIIDAENGQVDRPSILAVLLYCLAEDMRENDYTVTRPFVSYIEAGIKKHCFGSVYDSSERSRALVSMMKDLRFGSYVQDGYIATIVDHLDSKEYFVFTDNESAGLRIETYDSFDLEPEGPEEVLTIESESDLASLVKKSPAFAAISRILSGQTGGDADASEQDASESKEGDNATHSETADESLVISDERTVTVPRLVPTLASQSSLFAQGENDESSAEKDTKEEPIA